VQQVATLTRLLGIEPGRVDALITRAAGHLELGQRQAALDDYRKAAKEGPYDAEAANDLSWFLCTCPDPKLRDGKRALELANHACELSEWTQASFIDTLAAAYAEQRNFDEAIVWQQRAIDLAGKSQPELSQELQKRLELYKKNLPYREERPTR
jgi:Tfp pilus assembly protein PilF